MLQFELSKYLKESDIVKFLFVCKNTSRDYDANKAKDYSEELNNFHYFILNVWILV